MADFLIRHLEKKSNEHSALEMLVNQWGFDEKLISKALQSVGNLFPHYSRHDESHSRQILVNIERLLGDNINQLTATDTWLLLEAAYWHDIGMVVPHHELATAVNSVGFQQYIEQIRNTPSHELNRFAINFDAANLTQCFSGADTPLEAIDRFRQLMAEWFRRQHAERASAIIEAPWASVGISSPRTELIPARLFKLLGRICHSHGLSFDAILTDLPYRESGLAQEDCHPRFVACLLRMGDLLDLDDNRFCPVMQRISGENRPRITKAHEDKHASVRHLRVDPERIEISAECTTIDGYLETFKWFDSLKKEMQDQMARWQDITPSRNFGLLPTLGEIEVRLSGEQQILSAGHRPQFTVDGPKAIELLQGNNLYDTKFDCVRELLQNAVDATLLSLWLTEQGKETADAWHSPFSEGAKRVLSSKSVTVQLTEMPSSDVNVRSEQSTWMLSIADQGTGISREDLGHMLRIGGAQNNMQRQIKISTMPEWMKPSGTFGIGFQSVFLICDQVKMTTKSIFSNETLEVTMHSPTGNKEGLVLVRPLDNDISRGYGTTIEVQLSMETFAKSWSLAWGDEVSIAAQLVRSLDPVLDDRFPYEAATLADKIHAFSVRSPIPIKGTLTTTDGNPDIDLGTHSVAGEMDAGRACFVRANGNELVIRYAPTGLDFHPSDSFKTWYRGQPFESEHVYFPHVTIRVDLMSGRAGSWLTASRNKLAGHAKDALEKTVLAALAVQVQEDLVDIESSELLTPENRPAYSFFLESMAIHYKGEWIELAKKLDGLWLDSPTPPPFTGTFRNYFDQDSWVVGEAPSSGEPPAEGCDLLVNGWGGPLPVVLNEWLKHAKHTTQVLAPHWTDDAFPTSLESQGKHDKIISKHFQDIKKYSVRYQMQKVPQPPYSLAALATRLAKIATNRHGNERYVLNSLDGSQMWERLWLKGGLSIHVSRVFNVVPRGATFVLLPFLFCDPSSGHNAKVSSTDQQIEALCRWAHPNLLKPISLVEIRRGYEELISYIDDVVMRPSIHWDVWRNTRNIS
ncbi:MAG: hypothetical protein JWL63_1082 [Rhodocyclales bacterium]|nr:hypothetical protein [Rhodocyclales bacterium]